MLTLRPPRRLHVPGKPYVAVEPVTNMTDAVNRMDVPDAGLRILHPGETLTGHITRTLGER